MTSKIAASVAKKFASNKAAQFDTQDPHYETYTDERTGKVKKRKRPLPEGLSPEEQKLLKKIRRRAHYLDKGFKICGFRFGWTFVIGFIPVVGDVTDALLGYNLVTKQAKKADVPAVLISKMQLNTLLAAGIGFIPIAGDIIMAAFKPNSRNALLFEEFIVERARMNPHTSGSHDAGAHEVQAQTVIDRARQGNWSRSEGTNDALHHAAPARGPPPPLPTAPRPSQRV